MTRRSPLYHAVFLAACLGGVGASAETSVLPNPDFTEGTDAPAGWTLSGGEGRWADRDVLAVTGTGSGSNHWRCDARFEPAGLYRFEMRGRGTTGGGCVTSGPEFANCDHRVTGEWKDYGHVFRVPDGVRESTVRLGQWEAKGTVEFDRVRLVPVMPAHLQVGDLVLGEGEMIRDGRYTFTATFGGEGRNYHRPLVSATAGFNSSRWCFGDGQQVTYRFELPGNEFAGGELSFNVCWHARGKCVAEVSRDGDTWQAVATQAGVGTAQAVLPAGLLPAESIYLRLRSHGAGGSFQVDRVEMVAALDKSHRFVAGQTFFVDIMQTIPELAFERFSFSQSKWAPMLRATVKNNSRHSIDVDLLIGDGTGQKAILKPGGNSGILAAGESASVDFGAALPPAGILIDLELTGKRLESSDDGKPREIPLDRSAKAYLWGDAPHYYMEDFGQILQSATSYESGKKPPPGHPDPFQFKHHNWTVWWCPADHKVPPHHRPLSLGKHASLFAARNDREAMQIVVSADHGKLKLLKASVGPLVGPGGATIPAENVQVLRVAYHFVHHPTDKTGVRDWWPDALPPLNGPIDVPKGENRPLWVLVHVPKDARPGDYMGEVSLQEEGSGTINVPIKLHVWNFTLPDRNHLETAFGLSQGTINRYHQLKTDENKRRVWDMYLRAFAEHRLSPYDPVPMDPIRVHLKPDADPAAAEVDFSAFDPAFGRAVDKYHFNTFRLPLQGMGGGTFHSRVDPSIGKYGPDTSEYQAVFSSYVKQLESHFRQKGWLDIPYIYWFDEPDPKDYEFVRSGFERIKKYAPGLRTMLTEQPEEALAGPVDIWCPVSPAYKQEAAEARRKHGERFWWYVCCGPKEPYCTLFIDHPATELRVWLWQTWQRGIDGILVWSSNYWTSSAAFPDPAHPQNPYEDPMGYVSGYSTPKGTKRFWGNGDGRFLYPPEAAAVPGLSGPEPVVEPPVSSIRLEMLREGIEDWEYLYLLRGLVEKRLGELPPEEVKQYQALLDVPESITADMTTFTTDPAPIYARRQQVAEAIERLIEAPVK